MRDQRAIERQLIDFCELQGHPPFDLSGVPYLVVEFFDDDTGELLAGKLPINLQELARHLADAA